MAKFTVGFTKSASKQLEKLDRAQKDLILDWTEEVLEGCENPRSVGESLTKELSKYWRYRVGHYRLLAEIRDNDVLILVAHVGHRKNVYKDAKRSQ